MSPQYLFCLSQYVKASNNMYVLYSSKSTLEFVVIHYQVLQFQLTLKLCFVVCFVFVT